MSGEELSQNPLAIIADIHGNRWALEAVLQDIDRRGIQQTSGVFLRSTPAIEASVADIAQPVILCGHSHIPRTVFLPQGKLIINPGSVGLPRSASQLLIFPAIASAKSRTVWGANDSHNPGSTNSNSIKRKIPASS
jgi:predicted phosphodiesterase